jgi:hypothetical protein
MKTQLKFDQSKLMKKMDDISKKQVPFALSQTFNTLVYEVQQRLRKDVDKYFDGCAVKFTKSGIMFSTSSKNFLFASVFVESNRPYMKTMIKGGTVNPLKNNKALLQPAAFKVNKFGNIPRNAISNRKAKTDIYFIGKASKTRPYGLYRRYKKQTPKLMVLMENKSRNQKALFPATRIASKYIKRNLKAEFNRKFQRAYNNMRK